MPLTKSQLETQESRQEILNEANGRDPREFRWGYFGRDPFVLSGVGVFTWYASREDLLEALVEAEPSIHFEMDMPEFASAREALDAVRQAIAGRSDLPEEAREKANEILKGEAHIEWWGRLDDLVVRHGEFPREIRTWFRETRCDVNEEAVEERDGVETDEVGDGESDRVHALHAPIQEAEMEDFVAALAEYGI